MNICVVGTGYVGLVTGACFAEFGNQVTCVDKIAAKIESLQAGKIPIYEPGLDDLVQRNVRGERLKFTTNLEDAIREALIVIIAVGTPQDDDGRADLSFVRAVAKSIGENLDSYKVVVTKSTVPAGTGKMVREVIEENRKGDHPFSVASNPEFLREGSAIEDFMRPNRVVLGTEDAQSAAILQDLYRPLYLIETPIVVTDVVTAEVIKYASNAFLATKISFINEMADLCEAVGADVQVVAKAMGLDRRIGPKFLHAGPGYGGSCFPKDTRAVNELANDRGVNLRIVKAVIEVNDDRAPRMIEKIKAAVGGSLNGATLALLGLTFKPNTDDLRESPAIAILDRLLEAGATVRAFDPIANAELVGAPRDGVVYCGDEYEAVSGADALILATEWNQFRSLDFSRMKGLLARPIVVDLRNIYGPERMRDLGFEYTGVGR
ncbi:MAG: nucleotide sugar dehydrogenase [Acidobacteria bacterium]|nr:nucleotide sugar dehydrogenase [Acidobacteriota bacterium]NIM61477.1 nucleotide sugar dehydrogenase [Acidobacteriota bacterium]NIO58109.1 nucleotide sugar dehydrogenase [Acidobacteriota bacterium]NIQ29121.1 nucleotide sugar dehydrogenase [Acidobacteriota bacterium]NIQ83672.1 nucleotide sugar dehydrogenase [Acidobacteriota bacterium]